MISSMPGPDNKAQGRIAYGPNAMRLRTLLTERYRFDEATGVWSPRNETPTWGYSDGDEAEERTLAAISRSADRSSHSAELETWITDWASRYHLSRARSNLLRPFLRDLRGNVLEVGAGCGAITRLLGETAKA